MGNGGNISNDFCLLLNYDVPTGRRITQTFIDQIKVFSVMSISDVFGQPFWMSFFIIIVTSVAWGQVWTQKCAVQKASVDFNISYY